MGNDQLLIRAKKRHAYACVRADRIGEALKHFEQICADKPGDAESWFMAGTLYARSGRLAEAETALRTAVSLRPDLTQAHLNLGHALEMQARFDEAEECYNQALTLKADSAEAHDALGRLYQSRGDLRAAVDHYRRAVQLNPSRASAYLSLGRLLHQLGDLDEAAAAVEQALKLDPGQVWVAYDLAGIHIDQGRYDEALAHLENLLARDDVAAERRAQLHFRLGRLHDKRGEFAQAFAQFEAGKRLKPVNFDAREWENRVNGLIYTFNHEAMLRAPRAGNASERPVFIVGMPHAGIPLVERFLSLYPGVATVGELPEMDRLAAEFHQALAHTDPRDDVTQLSREHCDRLAQPYLDLLERRFSGSKRVIDTLPQNFLHLGIIALLFPMARVIHCVRDPLDTCLSCYFHEDGDDHPYAATLSDLGTYYRHYQRLMIHWEEILDMPIFEARYEDLVRDPDKPARAMAEFCGLKWDEQCLEVYRDEQRTTAGALQPACRNNSSATVGYWRHYADCIEPLRRALAGR